MNLPSSSAFDWAVETLAKALCTDVGDILTDPRLRYLLRCVAESTYTHGCATRNGIMIQFVESSHALLIDSGTALRAHEIAKTVAGARRGNLVAVLMPQSILEARLRDSRA